MGEGPAGDPAIVFSCPSCGQTIKVPRIAAGKRGKCNQCGTTVTIPAGEADTPFQPFAELEGSVQFEEPALQNTEAGASASGLVSLTPVANEEPDEESDEVPPEEIMLDPDPPEPKDAIEDLAVATAAKAPARRDARKSPWSVGKVIALILSGPIVFGIGYGISHVYSLRHSQKAPFYAPAQNEASLKASPAGPGASGKTASTPEASLPPGEKEILQGKLSEAMAKAQKIAKLAQNGHLSPDDRDELNLEVKEVLRLRGELNLPNWLIRDPDFGPAYPGDLASWNELQMILHPEKYPGCQVRVEKIKAPG